MLYVNIFVCMYMQIGFQVNIYIYDGFHHGFQKILKSLTEDWSNGC